MQYSCHQKTDKNHAPTNGLGFVKREGQTKTDNSRGHDMENACADKPQIAGNNAVHNIAAG